MNTPLKLNSSPQLIQTQSPVLAQVNVPQLVQDNPWLGLSSALCVALLGSIVFYRLQIRKVNKKVRFEQYKNQELTKKLKLALNTISKMEKNPDLVASREFNLDYLRMRMEEEHFNNAIMEQIRAKIKDKVATILRPKQTEMGIGVAIPGRHVDAILDVSYAPRDRPEERKVLFRVQVKLVKIPTQPSSQTIAQLIDCVEHYIKPSEEDEYWQPTVQGKLLTMEWDQKAKPTPLLVLEQGQDGGNVVFNTRNKLRHA
ncbi:MAG: hypothetical protein ACO3NK_12575 [Prochlorotrichaceae cyanobacterium]|jgi:hypothetical protein